MHLLRVLTLEEGPFAMKVYLLSLGAGILVGIVYSLLHVRSPAPPIVALVGLLGILIGEQLIPVGKQLLTGATLASACDKANSVAHVLGRLPGRHSETPPPKSSTAARSADGPHAG
jgi:XapX domain-containing protein